MIFHFSSSDTKSFYINIFEDLKKPSVLVGVKNMVTSIFLIDLMSYTIFSKDDTIVCLKLECISKKTNHFANGFWSKSITRSTIIKSHCSFLRIQNFIMSKMIITLKWEKRTFDDWTGFDFGILLSQLLKFVIMYGDLCLERLDIFDEGFRDG